MLPLRVATVSDFSSQVLQRAICQPVLLGLICCRGKWCCLTVPEQSRWCLTVQPDVLLLLGLAASQCQSVRGHGDIS